MAKKNDTNILLLDNCGVREYLDAQVWTAVRKAEAEELICASLYERKEEKKDYRNSGRRRKVKTRIGKIELKVPRLRTELAPCDIGVNVLSSVIVNIRLIDGWLKWAGFDIEAQ